MSKQQALFIDLPENLAIADRHKQACADRDVARYLRDAFEDEIIEIQDLMEYDGMTLYDAIAYCIKYPRHEDGW